MIRWTIAAGEEDRELGARWICSNEEELGVPYSWVTVMSSLIYPMEDNGFMIGRDREGRMAAAIAYTLGTLEDKYADRSRVEVHLLFFERRMRHGRPLLKTMRMLADHLMELPAGVREVVFFARVSESGRKFYGKFAEWKYTSEQPCGRLDFYGTTPERLLEYADRCRT